MFMSVLQNDEQQLERVQTKINKNNCWFISSNSDFPDLLSRAISFSAGFHLLVTVLQFSQTTDPLLISPYLTYSGLFALISSIRNKMVEGDDTVATTASSVASSREAINVLTHSNSSSSSSGAVTSGAVDSWFLRVHCCLLM